MPRAVYPSMAEDSRMGALLESDWPARPMPSMAKDSRMGALRLHSICRGGLPPDRKSTHRQASFSPILHHSRGHHIIPQACHVIPAIYPLHTRTPPTSFPRRRESGRALLWRLPRWDTGYDVIPATPCRHSREGGNLDARRAASVDVRAPLRRPPRRPGAEERRACGDEEGAGEEEEQQQAAGDAGAASPGELVGGDGRRGGRGRRRGHWRASWGHGWRGCGRGRPGVHDVI